MPSTQQATLIPMCDLHAQYETISEELHAAVDKVIKSQHFIMGPQVKQLEEEIATYSGTAHGVGCSSGSDALLLALMALDVGPGDEVITTPFTFFATAGAISRLGATPVFVDIEPMGYNIDPNLIEQAITPNTKAIIPVHLFGQVADMQPIMEIAERYHLTVIEDAAQAIGAEYEEKKAGSLGHMGCFSFFPSKNLGGIGDGGMVVTSDDTLAEKMRALRVHGATKKYFHEMVGANLRLDTINAAALLVKLKYLDEWNNARAEKAAYYRELISNSPIAEKIILPTKLPNRKHIYNQFAVRTKERDRVIEELRANRVASAIYYPKPLHVQECFALLGYKQGDLPVSEEIAKDIFALPIFPELDQERQEVVVEMLIDILS